MSKISSSSSAKKGGKGANSNAETVIAEPEFVLKHRIVGAAFLLFFGALVLPWVLGAPGQSSDQSLDANAATQSSRPVKTNAAGIRQENVGELGSDTLRAALKDEQLDIEEQVYISRITPLDANREASKEEQNKPATQPVANVPAEPKNLLSTEVKKKSEPKEVQVAAAKPAEPKSSPPVANKPSAPSETKPPETPKRQVAAVANESAIDVGWVVQVGVFTDKKGAGRVVDDLRDKGFTPSTTIVDTNRGKDTGTRIWLGPYAQRVEAAKAKAELTRKTGEAGFIRAYP